MGGDLNFKKQWHTQKLSNIKIVWDAEQKVEEEKRRAEQRVQEIKQEREQMELLRMQEDAGLIAKRGERLDWMYAGPNSAAAIADEKEAYLLGKKRIDLKSDGASLAVEEAPIAVQGSSTDSSFLMGGITADNQQRDLQNKIREDPLFAIRMREKLQVDAVLKNPLQRKQLEKQQHRKTKDSSSSSRRRSRSRSPGSSRSHRDRRDRSKSPTLRREKERHGHAGHSSRRDGSRERHRRERSDHREPQHRRREDYREPQRRHDHRRREGEPQRRREERQEHREQHSESREKLQHDRERRLEAMRKNAQELEQERRQRLREFQARQDQEERQEREQKQRHGGHDEFRFRLQAQAIQERTEQRLQQTRK